jgi:chromosome segregation ATPase
MAEPRRSRKSSPPQLADVLRELRALREQHATLCATVAKHHETLKIQFERIAQIQASLDEAGISHDQLRETLHLQLQQRKNRA